MQHLTRHIAARNIGIGRWNFVQTMSKSINLITISYVINYHINLLGQNHNMNVYLNEIGDWPIICIPINIHYSSVSAFKRHDRIRMMMVTSEIMQTNIANYK